MKKYIANILKAALVVFIFVLLLQTESFYKLYLSTATGVGDSDDLEVIMATAAEYNLSPVKIGRAYNNLPMIFNNEEFSSGVQEREKEIISLAADGKSETEIRDWAKETLFSQGFEEQKLKSLANMGYSPILVYVMTEEQIQQKFDFYRQANAPGGSRSMLVYEGLADDVFSRYKNGFMKYSDTFPQPPRDFEFPEIIRWDKYSFRQDEMGYFVARIPSRDEKYVMCIVVDDTVYMNMDNSVTDNDPFVKNVSFHENTDYTPNLPHPEDSSVAVVHEDQFRTKAGLGVYGAAPEVISIVYDGIQLLAPDYLKSENREYSMSDIADIGETMQQGNVLKKLKAADYYSGDSTAYNELTDKDIVIEISGDWNPVISPVTYINYDIDSRTPRRHWQLAISEKLGDTDTPVVIRESWSFMQGQDRIDIVTANNIEAADESNIKVAFTPEEWTDGYTMPAGDNHIAYSVTMIFLNGQQIKADVDIENLADKYFVYDGGEGCIFSNAYSSYQYDTEGNIILCPMPCVPEMNMRSYRCYDRYCYLDIDGDGSGELMVFNDTWSTSFGYPGVTSEKITELTAATYTVSQSNAEHWYS